MSPEVYIPILSVLIAILGGLFRGFAGFGAGLLMVPLLTLLHAPGVVVPALLVLSLMGDARLLPEVRKEVNVRRVLWLAIPALAGLPLGIAALSNLEPDLVRRFVNATVLVVAVILSRGFRFKNPDRPPVLVPAGMTGGFLTGVGGIGGPPIALTLLSMDEPASSTRANLIGYFSITNVCALAMMIVSGVFGSDSVKLVAICAVPYFVSIHLGSRRFEGTRDDSYRRIALVFLGTVALVGLLWPR